MVNSEDFKVAMRKYAYSVSIISNTSSKGVNNAITISSFTSISVDPPSVLACINKESSIHESLKANSIFCINLLGDNQKNIAELCSNPNKLHERFDNDEWTGTNPPQLSKAIVHLICNVEKIINYETHSIIIGVVINSKTSKHQKNLLYKDQNYLSI